MPITRRTILIATPAAVLGTALPFGPAAAQGATVTFILVNDIYLMGDTRMSDGKRRGGFARLAAVVKGERAKGGNVIFAHAGDTLSPSLMSGLDRGAHIITLLNMIPPDIFVPGNHEFDFGKKTFFQRMAEARFPVYAANLRAADGKPLPNIQDREIVTIDGVRIGLVGGALDDTPRTSSSEDLQFLPTVATTQRNAVELRKQGADFVVAVVHADRRQDNELFASHEMDLILSGHDHDLYLNHDEHTVIVESSYDAHYVTCIDVTFAVSEQDGRRKVNWWPRFRVIDTATVTPDPEVAAVVAKFEAELSRELDVPLATTAIELDSRNATVRTREAAIGNLMADAMRTSAKADAAIMNGGGIRAGKVYPPGSTLSRRDVLAELPFNNRLVTVELGGAELRRAIENGLSQWPNPAGRFPQVSGLRIEADGTRPAGSRVTAISVGGAPLDEGRNYRVATNDFIARGGDGYGMFANAPRLLADSDAPLLANEVMTYLRRLGTIKTGAEGRVVVR
jgi:2',3'-cyclic-nucleotide 2'-phosphodiesterase (5'-nucleotidase family)